VTESPLPRGLSPSRVASSGPSTVSALPFDAPSEDGDDQRPESGSAANREAARPLASSGAQPKRRNDSVAAGEVAVDQLDGHAVTGECGD
jgi:hypothetical protein